MLLGYTCSLKQNANVKVKYLFCNVMPNEIIREHTLIFNRF